MENYENSRNHSENIARRDESRRHGFFFDPWFDDFFFPAARDEESGKMMRTDIREDDNGYELAIDVPGLSKDQISLAVEDGYLTVTANRQYSSDQKDGKGRYIRKERFSGSCQRSFYVGDLDEKDVHAKLENGVLTVTFPKEKEQDREEEHHIAIE